MRKNIVLDLDDSMADFCNHIMEVLNKHHGTNHKKDDKHDYSFSMYGYDDKEFVQAMIDHEIIENIKPYFGVKETLDHVCKTHDIHIVTARSWHPDGYNVTKDWFNAHNLPYDSIRLVYPGSSKIDAISDLSHVDLAVDDRDTHCNEFYDCDIVKKVLMVNQPWNRHAGDHIKRINDIREILYYV